MCQQMQQSPITIATTITITIPITTIAITIAITIATTIAITITITIIIATTIATITISPRAQTKLMALQVLPALIREEKNKNNIAKLRSSCHIVVSDHLHHHFAPSSSASSLFLVTDNNNKRLSIWGADGHQHITNIKMMGYPRGVCIDLNGYLNVSCELPHVVCIYDPRKSYQLLQTLGDDKQGSAPGQFDNPIGMCVDDFNTLMVVEYFNHRVQFFD